MRDHQTEKQLAEKTQKVVFNITAFPEFPCQLLWFYSHIFHAFPNILSLCVKDLFKQEECGKLTKYWEDTK